MRSKGWLFLLCVLALPAWGQPRIRESQIDWKALLAGEVAGNPTSASRHVHDGVQGRIIYASTLETTGYSWWVGGDQQALNEALIEALADITTVTGAVVLDGQAIKWRSIGGSGKQPYIIANGVKAASIDTVNVTDLRGANVGSILLGGGPAAEMTEFFGAADNYIAYWDQPNTTWVAAPVTGDLSFNKGFFSIAADKIVNASISPTAAIALSKLVQGASGQVILSSGGNVWAATTLSGDVKVVNTGEVIIQPDAVVLGTDTTGNYVSSATGGTGITVSPAPGESADLTISAVLGTSVDGFELEDLAVADRHVAATAAIAWDKLATGTPGYRLIIGPTGVVTATPAGETVVTYHQLDGPEHGGQISAASISTGIVSSVAGVSNDAGDVDLDVFGLLAMATSDAGNWIHVWTDIGAADILDASLSSNVAFLNAANTFTAPQTISGASATLFLHDTTVSSTSYYLRVDGNALRLKPVGGAMDQLVLTSIGSSYGGILVGNYVTGGLTVSSAQAGTGRVTAGEFQRGTDVITDFTGNGLALSVGALGLGALTSDWAQTGAFDIRLANANSELRILESVGGTFYGTFDVGNLAADRTYTGPDKSGTFAMTDDLLTAFTGNLPLTRVSGTAGAITNASLSASAPPRVAGGILGASMAAGSARINALQVVNASLAYGIDLLKISVPAGSIAAASVSGVSTDDFWDRSGTRLYPQNSGDILAASALHLSDTTPTLLFNVIGGASPWAMDGISTPGSYFRIYNTAKTNMNFLGVDGPSEDRFEINGEPVGILQLWGPDASELSFTTDVGDAQRYRYEDSVLSAQRWDGVTATTLYTLGTKTGVLATSLATGSVQSATGKFTGLTVGGDARITDITGSHLNIVNGQLGVSLPAGTILEGSLQENFWDRTGTRLYPENAGDVVGATRLSVSRGALTGELVASTANGTIGLTIDDALEPVRLVIGGVTNSSAELLILDAGQVDRTTGVLAAQRIGVSIGHNAAAAVVKSRWAGGGTPTGLQLGVETTPDALSVDTSGNVTVKSGKTLTFGGATIDTIAGTGLQVVSGDLQTTLGTSIEGSEITDGTITDADVHDVDWLKVSIPGAEILSASIATLDYRKIDSASAAWIVSASIVDQTIRNIDLIATEAPRAASSIQGGTLAITWLQSLDGVTNRGGNIDLIEGANITITPNDGANTITIAAAAGAVGESPWDYLQDDTETARVFSASGWTDIGGELYPKGLAATLLNTALIWGSTQTMATLDVLTATDVALVVRRAQIQGNPNGQTDLYLDHAGKGPTTYWWGAPGEVGTRGHAYMRLTGPTAYLKGTPHLHLGVKGYNGSSQENGTIIFDATVRGACWEINDTVDASHKIVQKTADLNAQRTITWPNLSGTTALTDAAQTISGLLTFSRGSGAAFAVNSAHAGTTITNLNADLLDGISSGSFQVIDSGVGTTSFGILGENPILNLMDSTASEDDLRFSLNANVLTLEDLNTGIDLITVNNRTGYVSVAVATASLQAATVNATNGLKVGADALITDITGTGLQIGSGALQTTLGTTIEGSEITNETITDADIHDVDLLKVSILAGEIASASLANLDMGKITTGNLAATRLSGTSGFITSASVANGTLVDADIHDVDWLKVQVSAGDILSASLLSVDLTKVAITAGSIIDASLATISTAGKVSDTALSANVALENVANVFTQTQEIQNTAPQWTFTDTTASATSFRILLDGDHFQIQTSGGRDILDFWSTTGGIIGILSGNLSTSVAGGLPGNIDASGQIYSARHASTVTSGTVTLDFNLSNHWSIVTTGNIGLTYTNAQDGGSYSVLIKYGGAHTVTLAGGKFAAKAGTGPVFTSVNGKWDWLGLKYETVNSRANIVAFNDNFSNI